LSSILLFGKKNISFISILIIALSLGLTRSDLLRIFAISGIVLFSILNIFKKSENNKIILFLSGALLFSFISIQECKINPTSNECLEISVEESIELISFEDIDTITELDTDRKNIIDFLSNRDMKFFGKGFNSIVQEYQQYLTKEINEEMYITNRVLPNYLNKRYQSENFGTGNYSFNFYKPNTQSLLVNTIISSGLIFLLILFSFPIYKFLIKRDYESLLKILFLFLFFFVIPVEEFNALTGLIFGYGFRLLDMGVSVDKSI